MKDTLSMIGSKLNNANMHWGVGASMLLDQHGLADTPNDIDLVVSTKDIDKADSLLKGMGIKHPQKTSVAYATKHFFEYDVQGFSIDVMAGFAIKHKDGIYHYPFDNQSITERIMINNVPIAFTALEDWFVLYQLMQGREPKVLAIETHLLTLGICNPYLLTRALQGCLPSHVKARVKKLLESCE